MIVPIMIFAIPIIAILSSTYYKMQKLRLEGSSEKEDLTKLKKQIMYLESEQERLHERLATLEREAGRTPIERDRLLKSDFLQTPVERSDDGTKYRAD